MKFYYQKKEEDKNAGYRVIKACKLIFAENVCYRLSLISFNRVGSKFGANREQEILKSGRDEESLNNAFYCLGSIFLNGGVCWLDLKRNTRQAQHGLSYNPNLWSVVRFK